MPSIPLTPFILIALLLLPVKLTPRQLHKLAFAIWLSGGSVLVILGATRLNMVAEATNLTVLVVSVVLAAIVGIAKGKFVLRKTSQRNIARINAMESSQKPIHVYSLRSWIIIGVMMGIAILLNVTDFPTFWRGVINLGIGLALVVSSLSYLAAAPPKSSPAQ